MYCPIFYGKQFELLALRELSESKIVNSEIFKPIIDPVRSNLEPLIKTIEVLNQNDIVPFVIINPNLGDFLDEPRDLLQAIDSSLKYTPCVKVEGDAYEYKTAIEALGETNSAIYIKDSLNKEKIDLLNNIEFSIINKDSPNAAIEQLSNNKIILIEDAFEKEKRNADYRHKSFFSDLHVSYKKVQNNIVGFGDYTIVGSNYSESGGPAYVVTIHLSYIDSEEFDSMYIRHFSSDEDSNSPANPGGKFKDALNKLIRTISSTPKLFDETTAGIKEFKLLYQHNHYPGLGVVKKLSMKHHIETICNYLKSAC